MMIQLVIILYFKFCVIYKDTLRLEESPNERLLHTRVTCWFSITTPNIRLVILNNYCPIVGDCNNLYVVIYAYTRTFIVVYCLYAMYV